MSHGSLAMVRFLLDKGADHTTLTNDGVSFSFIEVLLRLPVKEEQAI